jgi:hypothetical protein
MHSLLARPDATDSTQLVLSRWPHRGRCNTRCEHIIGVQGCHESLRDVLEAREGYSCTADELAGLEALMSGHF